MQEIGHGFGLKHQNERFSNPNLGSCMDYTDDPGSGQPSNLHPNAPDFEQLASMYEHLDDGGGGGGGPGGGGPPGGRGDLGMATWSSRS